MYSGRSRAARNELLWCTTHIVNTSLWQSDIVRTPPSRGYTTKPVRDLTQLLLHRSAGAGVAALRRETLADSRHAVLDRRHQLGVSRR